jgi:hypothetical protein
MSPSRQPARAIIALSAIVTLAACSGQRRVSDADLGDSKREDVLLSNWKPPTGQKCTIAALPLVLPRVESLLDTITMPSYLAQGGIAGATGSALFSIKFDSTGAPRRAKVIETTLSQQASDILQLAVASAIQPQPQGEEWGVRVRVDVGPSVHYRIGRREVCDPVPIGRSYAPGAPPPPGDINDRTIEKRVQEVRFNVLIGADGTVLAAKLVAPLDNAEVEELLHKGIMSEQWRPGLDDRIPVAMSAVRSTRMTTTTRLRRVY